MDKISENSIKESVDIISRFNQLERDFLILKEEVANMLEELRLQKASLDAKETPEKEYDDEWYTNHGHGD